MIHVIKNIVNQSNGYSNFSIGSYETLVPPNLKKKINIHQELIKFLKNTTSLNI